MRNRARVIAHDGREICRLDVARSSRPVWTKTSKKDHVFHVRMNNSTRELPEADFAEYVADHWPAPAPSSDSEAGRSLRHAEVTLGRRQGGAE
jgi:hypothetical protein